MSVSYRSGFQPGIGCAVSKNFDWQSSTQGRQTFKKDLLNRYRLKFQPAEYSYSDTIKFGLAEGVFLNDQERGVRLYSSVEQRENATYV